MSVKKLLEISSSALSKIPDEKENSKKENFWLPESLMAMLCEKNGFYAFESALHVFPLTNSTAGMEILGIKHWNEKELWRDCYEDLTSGLLFFAEDVFGGQFAFDNSDVIYFDPESGEKEFIANSFEGWADDLLSNYKSRTGYPLALSWKSVNGPIPFNKRLLPKVPFLLGGEYDVSNLHAVDSVKGMQYRGEIWRQIKNLPDGTQVRLKTLPI